MEKLQLDDECWRILKGLTHSPKTPQMLARIYGMPIADTWKRIHFLEGLGIVRVVLTFLARDDRILYFYQVEGEPLSVVVEPDPVVYFEPAP